MADDTALMFGLTWIQDERKQQGWPARRFRYWILRAM